MATAKNDLYGNKETEQRRDEALRRALNTPPTPHAKKKPATNGGPVKQKKKPKD